MAGIFGFLNRLIPVRTVQVPRQRIHRSYSDSALILEPTTVGSFPDPLGDDGLSTHRGFRSSSPSSGDDTDRDSCPSSDYPYTDSGSSTSTSELLSILAQEFKEEVAEDGVSRCIFGKSAIMADYLFPSHSATESAVYFQPPTHCNVHQKTGYLRLEEIEDDEWYTQVEVFGPIPKVTHIFHECVIEFPPDDCLVALLTDGELIDSPGHASLSSTRKCQVCGIPVCGTGGKDSSFHRFKVFCSDVCYCSYALPFAG